MDRYHQVHEKDEASFDLSSTHRLPTISAVDALEDLEHHASRFVSTGLDDLDNFLVYSSAHDRAVPGARGGLPRGQVTEVWGPPASGKTAFGIQLAANALAQGQGAVWVDCSFTVSGRRAAAVTHVVRAAHKGSGSLSESPDEHLAHYHCPSLPHLIALLCRPTAKTLPSKTTVIIIDSLSVLINCAFPKTADIKPVPANGKGPGLSAKRLQTLQFLISALQKLAATRNCVVVVLSQCATKLQSESGATLVPSINATVWEQGISTRIVLFRDWLSRDHEPSTVCFAGIQKLEGKSGLEAIQSVAAFSIEPAGLVGIHHDASQASVVTSAGSRPKRKLGDAGLEVPDSDEDDEDYGWEDEDDASAPIPPQTQGSEDLILGVNRYADDDDDDDDDDDNDGKGEDADNGDEGVGDDGSNFTGEHRRVMEGDLDDLAHQAPSRRQNIDTSAENDPQPLGSARL